MMGNRGINTYDLIGELKPGVQRTRQNKWEKWSGDG
jgi:hypothetical protein